MASVESPPAKRILIVDDDPDVHQLLTLALNETDRHLESAYDGLEGLTKFETSSWDLVITDVIMPGIDGMELLERMRCLRPEVPVVMMTVDSTAQKIVSAIRDHAFFWFRKPFTTRAVREAVDSALKFPRLANDIEVLSASPHWLELRLRCDMGTATRALQFVREMVSGLPEGERENVALAFREILFNAVEHGGGNDPNVYVTITCMQAAGALLFRVRDPGPGFSFDRLRHAAILNPPDSPLEHVMNREALGMRPGGFGILMMRAYVDELLYNERGNEALLIKYLRRPS